MEISLASASINLHNSRGPGEENSSSVEEGFGKPWVSEMFNPSPAALILQLTIFIVFLFLMELHHIRGGTKDTLERGLYNIGVGISLGNKWFTPENIGGLIEWALKYTKEYVVVYVADSIHAINEEVRGKMTKERAMARSLKKGEEIINAVKEIVDQKFSKEDQKRIVFVTWNEIVNEKYEKKMAYLIKLFYSSLDFSTRIKKIVSKNISKEERVFAESDIEKLSMYILHELPEVLCRVPMKQYSCDAYVYPFDGELTQLAEEMQKGNIFPEIKENIIDTEPKVFLEVR